MKTGDGICKRLTDYWKQVREKNVKRQRDKIRTSPVHSLPLLASRESDCDYFFYIKAQPGSPLGTFTLSRRGWVHEAADVGAQRQCAPLNVTVYGGTYGLNEVLDICQRLQELHPVFEQGERAGKSVADLVRKMGDEYEETPWRHLDKESLLSSLERGRGPAPAVRPAAKAAKLA